jgi:hypothetical protein
MKFSIVCFIVALVLGLVSMGLLGQLLYYLVAPILRLRFPALKSWTGDWVWPAMIYISVLWPFGFLIAGWANLYMVNFAWPKIVTWGAYAGILLLWDLLLWFLILTLLPKPRFP